ncbi:MAG TPA: EAL domain-containing protein [Actinomycetes bacterium]|nr:EAL domain-containing protein [Actinomycetes bacterium]
MRTRSEEGTAAATAVSRPTRRVLVLSAGLCVLASGLLFAVVRNPPEPLQGVHIPWYVLTLLFAATEAWVFHIQFGREAKSISISEIPLVIGLFYTTPQELVLARLVGPALVVLLYRRQTALKAIFNISLFYTDVAVALAVFDLLGGGSVEDGARTWIAAIAAATLAIVVDLALLSMVVRWYNGRTESALRGSLPGVVISAASATVGLVAVLTLRMGALAAVPLLVAGAVLMAFFRAYSLLADRHTSLERLFRFSHELNGAPATTDVLPAVLSQARQLLRAERAEVLRFASGDNPAPALWRFDGDSVVADSSSDALVALGLAVPYGERRQAIRLTLADESAKAFLRSRGAREAVVAPLVVEGETAGLLAAYDRLGEVRGFEDSDVTLLQTVANHASVALHNETLIGRLRHEALHDTLTGLPNRAALMSLAESAVARATAGDQRLAMMIIDLNGFKAVNDTLGHSVGDQLICEVARRFSEAAGPWVTVARLGGDEFAVLAERLDDDGTSVAGRLTDSLLEPLVVDQDRLHLSGSIGIALSPEHATTVGDLLKRADIAMYVAKNGPEPVALYRPDIDGHDPTVLSLIGELREAIQTGEVTIEVEPVLDLLTGELASAEALLRWHHPTRGTLLPSAFLSAAERNGLIIPLTERVLDLAVGACSRWQEVGLHVGVSVNISTRSLMDQRLPTTVATALERHRLPAHLLTLEITESIVLSDADRALSLLDELRGLGVRLSLDDFGTGYSSLTYLSSLPIQQVKIDQTFVADILTSTRDAAIVSSMIELAHHLGLQIIAEGIENDEVRERLRHLGCDFGQGFLYATSMDPDELPEWEIRHARASGQHHRTVGTILG